MMRRDTFMPGVALAVYAHPDDLEVSAAGTLAAWARQGAAVHAVIVNLGEKGSTDPASEPGALAQRRAAEVEASASVIGIASVANLGRPDGESENDLSLRSELVTIVRRLRPEVVVCPDPSALFFGDTYVNHRDHRVAGLATLDAVAPAAGSPLYFPANGAAHHVAAIYLSGTLEPDTWIAIDDVIDLKVAALSCHASQLGDDPTWVAELVRERALAAGRRAGGGAAETFRVIRLIPMS